MSRFDWSALNIDAVHARLLECARTHGLADPAVRFAPVIASTNTALLQAPFVGEVQPAQALIAAEQTAGRGRQGRTWLSQAGRSACLSLALEFAAPALASPGLPLAVGVSLAQAFATQVPGLALKWPNDLLRESRKCAGILIESRRGSGSSAHIERVVIGVGLNLYAPLNELNARATGLFDAAEPPTLDWIVATALVAMLDAVMQHRAGGLEKFAARWNQLDAYRNEAVVVSDAGRVLARGINLGLGAGGALRVRDAQGEVQVISGDVSLRPLPDRPEPGGTAELTCAL